VKVRVLHVLNELRPSGAEVMLVQASPVWRAEGIESEILACGVTPGPFAQDMESAGFRVHHLPFQKTPASFCSLIRSLRRIRPDVVHIHSEAMSSYVALAARLVGLRRVLRTVHSVFRFEGALRIRKRFERQCQRILGVRELAIGPSVHENELTRFGVDSLICLNWCDTDYFRPPAPEERAEARARFGLTPDVVAISTVGNCAEVKNHSALLHALASISPGPPWVYLHAGNEAPGMDERRLASALGLADDVRFLGPVKDVRSLLWASDVFVMPSLYEGLGIAALEAAGTGVPMILTNVPGLRDFMAFDKSDSILWANDPTYVAIGEALERIFETRLTNLPRPWLKDKFSIDCGVARYAGLYLGRRSC